MKVIEQLGPSIHIYKDYITTNYQGSLSCNLLQIGDNRGVFLTHYYKGEHVPSIAQGISLRLERLDFPNSLLVLMAIKIAEEHIG